MTAPLVQRLSLVVDAATGGTEARMDALATSSREAGQAAERSAGQVAAAAERVAAAQLRRDDATDKVRLAEVRLQELQAKGVRSDSQLLAAEQRLESARRNLHVATRGVEEAQQQQTRAQDDATESTARAATEQERARLGAERFGGQLESLRGQAAAFGGGFLVGDWLRDQTQAFLEGARGANTLSTSMNATVEEGGRLSQLFSSLGLDSADLLEIQAEFATKIGENGRNLQTFGAAVKTNADGTTNWASTLVDALSHLQKIPDATERNRLGFQLFGEEGYKQLSRLLSSGMSVEDAMAAIGTPFTEEDVRTAQHFDRSMLELNLSSSGLGRTLARNVVPAASAVVGGLNDVVSAVGQIPLPVGLATTAAIALGRTGFDPLARGGEALRTGFGRVRDAVTSAASGVEAGAGRMARGAAIARSGVGGLSSMLGGPAGIAAIGIGLAWAAASAAAENLSNSAADANTEVDRMGGTTNDAAANTQRLAEEWESSAGFLERYTAASKLSRSLPLGGDPTGIGALADTLTHGGAAAAGFEQSMKEAREELGEFGAQQTLANATGQSLANMIALGTTSGKAFAQAVASAADAERAQTRTSDTATAAIAAYRAQTDGAVQSVRGLIDAQLSQADAGFGFLSAMDAARKATDDTSTSINEVTQAHVQLQEAALRAGDAAADAAVAQAQAAGKIVTPLEEAKIRADALITDLRTRLNTPGLGAQARAELQTLIDRLTEAQDKGDVKALVTLTGVDVAAGGLANVTADRESHINVESRGGPAVNTYLEGLAKDRPAHIRVDSRNGPAVKTYLDSLMKQRLALFRAESRNGPAVNTYLNSLTRERLAIIRVETRGGPAVDSYLDGLAGKRRVAIIDTQTRDGAAGSSSGGAGSVAGLMGAGALTVESLQVIVQADAGGRVTAAAAAVAGRDVVRAAAEYTRQNGNSWLRGLLR